MPEHLKDVDLDSVDSLQPKWYSILHSTYNKEMNHLQPEILLKVSIEVDGEQQVPAQQSPTKKSVRTTPKKQQTLSKNVNTDKFIQIGDANKPNQARYTFSLCLKNLSGILDLIRANSHVTLQPDAKLYMYSTLEKKYNCFKNGHILENLAIFERYLGNGGNSGNEKFANFFHQFANFFDPIREFLFHEFLGFPWRFVSPVF